MTKLSANHRKGMILILTFMIMITIIGITTAFLYITSIQIKASGYDIASSKALWLAEAGLQKAVWNLKTSAAGGGQGQDWTTVGTTENLGSGNYTMEVERWDFALIDNRSSASATSVNKTNAAANVIDGDDTTYWQSGDPPRVSAPQEIIITFPYTLTINKARFLVPSDLSIQRPKDYEWQVSTDGASYTTVVSVSGNNDTDVTDVFTAVTDANYFKLRVFRIGGGTEGACVSTLEVIGSKITSTGTVDVINRKIEQTVVVDDATGAAYDEIDWYEIM